jgi:DNA repair photolyase
MNIYRGCSHGCIYCDSRSKCYQFPHDFEDIEVKQNAPELLEIIDRYNFGATMITKADLVLRDLDILERINNITKAVVQMTLTTADDELCRKIEPGVCPTSRRMASI